MGAEDLMMKAFKSILISVHGMKEQLHQKIFQRMC